MPRLRLAVGLGAIALLAATGCTSGDQDGESLRVDDGGDAAAAVASAIEDTRSGSGRFVTTFEEFDTNGDAAHGTTMRVDGTFDGEVRHTTTSEEWLGSEGGADQPTMLADTERLVVGDRTWAPATMLREVATAQEPGESDAFSEYFAARISALDGIEWIETTGLGIWGDDEDQTVSPMVTFSLATFMNDDPFEVLAVVEDVSEVGTTDDDGVVLRHFTGDLPVDAVERLMLDESVLASSDDEYRDAVSEYLESRTTAVADLYVDGDGRLVRSEVRTTTDIEDRYRDCQEIYEGADDSLVIRTEFSDLDADLDLPGVPDPSSVMTLDELAAAFPYDSEDLSGDGADLAQVDTVDGPRDRAAVVNDLSKYGYVIGLVPDPWVTEPDRAAGSSDHVRNGVVDELDDAALVAAYAEASAALASMPRTATALGELTRPELLWNVKVGMQHVGVDLAVADGLSDAQLGELIDSFVADNGWIVGDGIWGDMSPELLASFQRAETGDVDLDASGTAGPDDTWRSDGPSPSCPG